MEHFPRHWAFVRGIHWSPVNCPHKGQWRGALMFSLIWAWINAWVNNREAGDLRRHRGKCDVIVMKTLQTPRAQWVWMALVTIGLVSIIMTNAAIELINLGSVSDQVILLPTNCWSCHEQNDICDTKHMVWWAFNPNQLKFHYTHIYVCYTGDSLQRRNNERDGVSNHQPHDCLLNRLFRENIKAPRHWPLCGNSPVTGEFPSQRASNAENFSIWWRHHLRC